MEVSCSSQLYPSFVPSKNHLYPLLAKKDPYQKGTPFSFSLETQAIYRTAAAILSTAVSEIFPKAELVHLGMTSLGFYGDFVFDHPLDKNGLTLLQERMQFHIQKNSRMEMHVMTKANAASFLRHYGKIFLAKKVGQSSSSLIELFQMGSSVGLISHPLVSETREVGFVKLLQAEKGWMKQTKKTVYRMKGIALPSKEKIQEALTVRQKLEETSHLAIGKRFELFDFFSWYSPSLDRQISFFWKKQGLEILDTFLRFGKKLYQAVQFPLVSSLDIAKQHYLAKKRFPIRLACFLPLFTNGELREEEGLFLMKDGWRDYGYQAFSRFRATQEIQLAWQLIKKVLQRIGLETRMELLESKGNLHNLLFSLLEGEKRLPDREKKGEKCSLIFFFIDRFGREWKGPYLEISSHQEGILQVTFSLFGKIETVIALLLEAIGKQVSQKKDLLDRLNSPFEEETNGL